MTFSSVPVIDGKDWKEFTLLAVFWNIFGYFSKHFYDDHEFFSFSFWIQWSCQGFIHDRLGATALLDLQSYKAAKYGVGTYY